MPEGSDGKTSKITRHDDIETEKLFEVVAEAEHLNAI